MTFRRARDVTLLVGLVIIGLVVLTMTLRDVDPIEITATVAFAPVFVAFLFFGWRIGLAVGVLAAGGYLAMRIPAIRIVGVAPIFGTLTSRVLGYLVFGGVGGWAAQQLQAAMDKLELHDEIDDATGLGNARSVVNAIEHEKARATRYGMLVSVIDCRFRMPSPVGGRVGSAEIRRLGTAVAHSVRTSDHAAHLSDDDEHRLILVLPETSMGGATTVASNLDREIRARIGVPTEIEVLGLPDDADRIDALSDRLSASIRT